MPLISQQNMQIESAEGLHRVNLHDISSQDLNNARYGKNQKKLDLSHKKTRNALRKLSPEGIAVRHAGQQTRTSLEVKKLPEVTQFRAQTQLGAAAIQLPSFRKPKPLKNFNMKSNDRSRKNEKLLQNNINDNDLLLGKSLFKKIDSSVEHIGKATLLQSSSNQSPAVLTEKQI